MDTVSRLLDLAHLTASLDKRCVLGAATRMQVAGHERHAAPFHVLLEGTCELHVGRTRLRLRSGDVVVIPSGASHRIVTAGSGRKHGVVDIDGDAFVTTQSQQEGPPVIDLYCGRYLFGAGAGAMLFRTLPEPLHVSFGAAEETDDVLRMLSTLIRGEARHEGDGTAAILSALCVVLMALVLRSSSAATRSAALWTAASNGRVAAAVAAVLGDPGADWSIDRLSREAGMSRATFLRHFTQETGMTPGSFVTKARLMLAADLLVQGDATVASIALEVGYRSESAFSRAFSAEVGTTPARFRREQWR
jgi:AraC family transcriptional activator of mtrCDE